MGIGGMKSLMLLVDNYPVASRKIQRRVAD